MRAKAMYASISEDEVGRLVAAIRRYRELITDGTEDADARRLLDVSKGLQRHFDAVEVK